MVAQAKSDRRLQQISPSIERRVVQHEFWVTMMPFGLGQLQNGDRKLGIFLATLVNDLFTKRIPLLAAQPDGEMPALRTYFAPLT